MSNHASRSLVRDIFREQLKLFSEYHDTRSISLKFVKHHFDPNCVYRDMAWAEIERDQIILRSARVSLMEKALDLSENNLIALLRHEIAHCIDPFVNEPGAEQRADDIAYLVCGDKIRYDGDLIQTIGYGSYPRPLKLRR